MRSYSEKAVTVHRYVMNSNKRLIPRTDTFEMTVMKLQCKICFVSVFCLKRITRFTLWKKGGMIQLVVEK